MVALSIIAFYDKVYTMRGPAEDMNISSKITHLFPHFSRLFPVWLLFLGEHILLVALITLFILAHTNGIKSIGRPCCSDSLYLVLDHPWNLEAKLSLAREYWKNGQEREAKHETDIVRDMLGNSTRPYTNPDSQVLGASTLDLEDTLRAFRPKPEETNTEISFWKKIIEDRPDYRDGYAVLAILSYRKKSFLEAAMYKDKALSLDPNYIFPKELTTLR